MLERESTPDRSWGWVARTATSLGSHRIGFGADGNYQGYGGIENTFVREDYFPRPITDDGDEWDASRWQGAFVDDTWNILEPLDLYVGLRYDTYYSDQRVDQVTGYAPNGRPSGFEQVKVEFDEDVLLPKAGLVYRPLEGFSLYGRFARATRMPDNPAFYWYSAGYRPEVDPNIDVVRSDLSYEDALQYEAGLRYTGVRNLSLGLNFYYYDVDDREVPFLGDPGAPYEGAGDPDGAPLGSPVTLQELDDFTVVDLMVRYPVWNGKTKVMVTGMVENLFDEDYEEEFGFPAPGQSFFIGVELTL